MASPIAIPGKEPGELFIPALGKTIKQTESREDDVYDTVETATAITSGLKYSAFKTITDKKLFTLDEVRAHTKASSSCGSCTGLVEALLASTLGGDYSTTPKKKPMCPCTEHAHDDVRWHGFGVEAKTPRVHAKEF